MLPSFILGKSDEISEVRATHVSLPGIRYGLTLATVARVSALKMNFGALETRLTPTTTHETPAFFLARFVHLKG